MGWFNDDSQQAEAYQQTQSGEQPHEASWTHEIIAGAASYEAMRAYEKHCDQNGDPGSHQEAKEILAGFSGAFVDREAETKGLDWIDRDRAKREAQQQTNQAYDQHQQNQY